MTGATPSGSGCQPTASAADASSRNDIPSAISTAELKIGSVTLIVHQLDNGQRVIEAASFEALMAAMEDGSLTLTPEDGMKLAKVVLP